jgi:hypothetical protein
MFLHVLVGAVAALVPVWWCASILAPVSELTVALSTLVTHQQCCVQQVRLLPIEMVLL